jgi:acyl-CoA reductase-like NAD-dependent aldehyde dehydrogenase
VRRAAPREENDEQLRGDQSRNRGADQDFPTITDDELDAAIALTNQTHRTWLRSTTVEERAKLVRRVGEHTERREHSRTRGSAARVM